MKNSGQSSAGRFAKLVENGLRADLRRLHADLLDEESRLTALEEIRWHSMKDFEALGEGGVSTAEAALYYTLFHQLTQEIDLQGRLVISARRRVRDKRAAVITASEERRADERVQKSPHSRNGPPSHATGSSLPLKKAS